MIIRSLVVGVAVLFGLVALLPDELEQRKTRMLFSLIAAVAAAIAAY